MHAMDQSARQLHREHPLVSSSSRQWIFSYFKLVVGAANSQHNKFERVGWCDTNVGDEPALLTLGGRIVCVITLHEKGFLDAFARERPFLPQSNQKAAQSQSKFGSRIGIIRLERGPLCSYINRCLDHHHQSPDVDEPPTRIATNCAS